MKPWDIDNLRAKRYPHFDAPISKKNIIKLIDNPKLVASHKFHPFLYFEEKFQPFRPQGKKVKIRPIRYACRADSYIFTRYRHKLAVKYEEELKSHGISECVLAYRHIPVTVGSERGKSNIEFAKEIFDVIADMKNCVVVTADISSYFDSIDHVRLKAVWGDLIGKKTLPDDHFAVFKNLTNYRDVDYKELCRALGYFGQKKTRFGTRDGYLVSKKDIPTQICSNAKFRSVIRDYKAKGINIVNKNKEAWGIPQGSPMSDVLANAYLFEFDTIVNKYAKENGGFYYRYSDDIIVILPGKKKKIAKVTQKFLMAEISKTGPKIRIQPKKCASLIYFTKNDQQSFRAISKTPVLDKDGNPEILASGKKKNTYKMRNGLEYLGFRYDGKFVYLRDKTVSKFYRKLKRNAWAQAYKIVARYPDKKPSELISIFNYEEFFKRFGKVEKFYNETALSSEQRFKTWTFFTYVKRASQVFGDQGKPMFKQIANFQDKTTKNIKEKIIKVYALRSN